MRCNQSGPPSCNCACKFKACLHGGGGLQVSKVTRLVGVTQVQIQFSNLATVSGYFSFEEMCCFQYLLSYYYVTPSPPLPSPSPPPPPFQFTKFSFIDFVLTDRKNMQVNGQNWPVGNLPVVIFCSQPQEMSLPKPLNM